MLPTDPIDCATLRRRNGCALYINAINVPDLDFYFDGVDVLARSQNKYVRLRIPDGSDKSDIMKRLREDLESVTIVEVDPFGNDACYHSISTAEKA